MALHLRPVVESGNIISLQIGGSLDLNLRVPPQEGFAIITAHFGAFSVTSEGNRVAYTLPSNMLINVEVAYVDAAGNPASVDGEVTWATSNDSICTVATNSNDSTECVISAIGPTGSVQISATADADLGNGVRELVTLLDVLVVAGEAVAGTIEVVGQAQPIEPAAA